MWACDICTDEGLMDDTNIWGIVDTFKVIASLCRLLSLEFLARDPSKIQPPNLLIASTLLSIKHWVNDGRMGGWDGTYHISCTIQWTVRFFSEQEWSLLLFDNIRFILFERQFVPLKQTTFTENDRLWFLLAINIIFMHPSSLMIIDHWFPFNVLPRV